jgi:hypothetical protein
MFLSHDGECAKLIAMQLDCITSNPQRMEWITLHSQSSPYRSSGH